MSDLYYLRRPVRQILTKWLDSSPLIPDTFEGVPRNNSDFVFHANPEYAFSSKREDKVKPAVVPRFAPRAGVPRSNFNPEKLEVGRRLDNPASGDNLVYEVKWHGDRYVLKVDRQTIEDQENKRDRHLIERNAYDRLLQSGLCGKGVVPRPHGYFHIWGRQHEGWETYREHWPYDTWLQEVTNPAEYPRAILLEDIPNVARLPRNQFTHKNIFDLFDTLSMLHVAGVIHGRMEVENVLWNGKGFVLVDFNKAMIYPEGKPISKTQCSRDLIRTWQNFMFNSW